MISWIFFDLDGVLLDSRQWHFDALHIALTESGIHLNHAQHTQHYDGLPTKLKLELLAERFQLDTAAIVKIHNRKQILTRRFLAERITRSESLVVMLGNLRAQGLRIALCSNAIRETVDTCLAKLMVTEFFDFTLSSEDVRNPKPSSEMYEQAIRLAGVTPHEILIVEDSPHGVKAAKGTSCHLLIVRDAQDLSLEKILSSIANAHG